MANRLKKRNIKENSFTALNWIIAVFLMILFVLYPLYVGGGYTRIDSTKYITYVSINIVGLIVMIPAIIVAIMHKQVEDNWKSRFSITDSMVVTYAVAVLLSAIFSQYKSAAMLGQAGWYMGCVLIEGCCLLYFIISRFFKDIGAVTKSALYGSFICFALGALNRFGYWPINMEIPYHYDFISTVGNIGWYCGFWAVIAPLGIGIYVAKKDLPLSARIMLGIYVFVAFFTGSSQGSDTIYVVYAVLFVCLMVLCGVTGEGFGHLLEVIMFWCGALLLIGLIRYVSPDRYHYDTDNFSGLMSGGLIGLWILIPVMIVYLLVVICKIRISYKVIKYAGFIFAILGAVAVGVVLLAFVVSCGYYFHSLNVNEDSFLSNFIINMEWGNGRGATVLVGLECFLSQNFLHKLLGAGPDSMASVIYYNEQLSAISEEMFDTALIANAHNELITNLAHTGILGSIAYYGIILSYVCRSLKAKAVKSIIYSVCVMCVTGYAFLNYAHILSFPFLFIMVAMGENILRHNTDMNKN